MTSNVGVFVEKTRVLLDLTRVDVSSYPLILLWRLIFKAYEQVRPIDDATAPGTYDNGQVFFVDPVDPVGNPLDIQWSIDGQPILGATGTQLDTSTLSLGAGMHAVSVEVVDNTSMVRDETMRASLMTQQETWTLNVGFTPVLDFGDAPFVYPMTLASDGASHDPSGPRLGSLRDAESDGFASSSADGDNANGDNDEDGVLFGIIAKEANSAGINLDVQNVLPGSSQGAASVFADAWIDFNHDGDWYDNGEKILNSVSLIEGLQTLSYMVPADTLIGETFARVRISSEG